MWPLLVGNFLGQMVLWYSIEKLFMSSIGFDGAAIGIAVAITSATKFAFEIPSGILADRWSRKWVFIIGCAILAVSTLICGLSTNVAMYTFGVALWGVFYAMRSGMLSAMVYDTLLEETGRADGYEKYYGKVQISNSLALVCGCILGAAVGELISLQAAFLLTVPFSLLSILFVLRFREPKLHLKHKVVALGSHVKETFTVIAKSGILLWVAAAIALVDMGTTLIFEYAQLWYVALAFPVLAYGPIWALMNGSIGVSGFFAHKFKNYWALVLLASSITVLGFGLFTHVGWLVVFAHFVLLSGMFLQLVHFLRAFNDRMPSRIRAGAESTVSTLAQLTSIPVMLLFGVVASQASVFNASWLIIAVAALLLICLVAARRLIRPGHQTAEDATEVLSKEEQPIVP